MEIIRVDVDRKDFTINLHGDIHRGSVNVHHGLKREMIQDIADGSKYAFNLGDNIEAILPNDRRYSSSSVDREAVTPAAQRDLFIEDFAPIKEHIKAIGIGNHELKLINTLNIGSDIAKALGTRVGGVMYVVAFYYNDKLLFKIMLAHGARTMPKGAKDPIQREANQLAWLKRQLDGTGISDCILMAMGHTHQLKVQSPTVDNEILITSSDNDLHQHTRPEQPQNISYIAPERRWYVNTGGFRKLYTKPGSMVFDYAETMMLQPTRLGWADVDVWNGEVVDVYLREGAGS